MTDSRKLFTIMVFSALALCVGGVLRADTATASPSPTETLTPTPGPGSFSYTVYNSLQTPLPTPFVVPANTGNSLQIDYTVTTTLEPGSELVFDFPSDLTAQGGDQPSASTFYADALYQPYLSYAFSGSSGSGYAVTVTTGSTLTIPAGTTIIFTYGQDPTGGFAVYGPTTQTSESFMVWANPAPQTEVPGVGLVPAPSPILVYSPTVSPTDTPTSTITPTLTISNTDTVSPTSTPASPTDTPTPTPVGPVRPSIGFYTYPNPFDLRSYPFVTVRFQPTAENVSITIFSLAGNPVCEIPASDIHESLGVAQWNGQDDYGRVVPGGLYFVRMKTPANTVVHKMTVFH
jgi:hypothetical protein